MFSFAVLLLVFLTSCAPQVEELDNLAGLQADEGASTHTFHALIPGTLDHVYQMELTVYGDGTAEAVRSVISFDPDLDYSDYQLVGADETIEVGNTLEVNFTASTYFIPFATQVDPSIVFETQGSLILNCWCPGGGVCGPRTINRGYDTITSAECFSRACTSCNSSLIHDTSAPVSIPGVVIASSSVSVN